MSRLLIRPGGIGDCITCFPAMEFLRSSFTEVWAPSAVAPLVQFADVVKHLASTGIDLVGIEDVKAPEAVCEALRGFDEIVSWYGSNRPSFRKAALALNPNWCFLPALPPTGSKEHVTDFHCRLVGAPMGLRPRISVMPKRQRQSIVIHPFSGSARKNWPMDRFLELQKRLSLPVEWTAGPEEPLPGAKRFSSLLELAEWIAEAALYIGNDSGISHLAAAAGVPCLVLFGPTDHRVWEPRGNCVVTLTSERLSNLAVQEVLEAAEAMCAEARKTCEPHPGAFAAQSAVKHARRS